MILLNTMIIKGNAGILEHYMLTACCSAMAPRQQLLHCRGAPRRPDSLPTSKKHSPKMRSCEKFGLGM
jgi:hypothetical protein